MNALDTRLEEISKNWGWLLTLGIFLALLGLVALSATVYFTLATILFLGILLLIAGFVQCILAVRAPQWSGFFLTLLGGLMSMVVGYLFISTPGVSALSVTLLMAAFLMVSGLFKMFTAVMHRLPKWGWLAFNGLVSLILGLFLWAQWPVSGLWAIGLFLGIDLLMAGFSWIIIAISIHQVDNGHRLAHP